VLKIDKLSVANKILLGQLGIIMAATSFFLITGDLIDVKSAVYGGLAAWIPNAYFAYKINKNRDQEARKVVKAFYTGESGKLLITALMFALIFQDPNIEFIAVFVTYVASLTVFWFALLLRKY